VKVRLEGWGCRAGAAGLGLWGLSRLVRALAVPADGACRALGARPLLSAGRPKQEHAPARLPHPAPRPPRPHTPRPQVTPSSKVVGDLAQFMVQNDLDEKSLVERAEQLSFPGSVVEFMQGYIGQPAFGFPEPLRSRVGGWQAVVVEGRARARARPVRPAPAARCGGSPALTLTLHPSPIPRAPPVCPQVLKGKPAIAGRPGESMEPLNLELLAESMRYKYGPSITDKDVLSAAIYPQVRPLLRSQLRRAALMPVAGPAPAGRPSLPPPTARHLQRQRTPACPRRAAPRLTSSPASPRNPRRCLTSTGSLWASTATWSPSCPRAPSWRRSRRTRRWRCS
jgi:hypothetical protein